MEEIQQGRPLAISQTAQSASTTEPAFAARPEGAPVYHGFVVLDDVVADGFTLGKITDWEAEPCETGDAFVIAPLWHTWAMQGATGGATGGGK